MCSASELDLMSPLQKLYLERGMLDADKSYRLWMRLIVCPMRDKLRDRGGRVHATHASKITDG